MSREGDEDFPNFRLDRGNIYAFIDADNVRLGMDRALINRDLTKDMLPAFDLSKLLNMMHWVDRFYIYSAIDSAETVPEWISSLRSQDRFIFKPANLKTTGTTAKQEGVDVLLTVDALQAAHKRTMTQCVIFSCDGDLLPLINALIEEGIKTAVACFNDPKKGDVASRLRDAADSYIHVGNRLLTKCMRDEYACIGRQNLSIYAGQPVLLDEEIAKWEAFTKDNGSVVLARDRKEGSESASWLFPNETGARAWLMLNRISQSGRSEEFLRESFPEMFSESDG